MLHRAAVAGPRRRRARVLLAAGAPVLALVLAACGSDDGDRAAAQDPAPPTASSTTDTGGSTGAPTADDAAGDPAASSTPGLDPALAVPAPGPRTGPLETADLLVSGSDTLPAATVQAISGLKGVTSVLPVELAQVSVEGRALNVLAVDPAAYRAWTPAASADLQDVWDRIAGGEVAVPPTVDEKLVDAAGYVRLGSGESAPEIHVGAYAPQVPFIDAVVNDKWGEKLGMKTGTALLVSTGIKAPAPVQKLVQQLVKGQEVTVQGLDAVARYGLDPGAAQQAFLVGSVADAVGTYRYTVSGAGSVTPEASWVSSHIGTETVPILGSVTCNTAIFPQLKAALGEIVDRGLADKINPGQYAGCYYPRFIAGSNRLSNHAFGLALDLNVPGNQRGTVGEMDRGVVDVFKRWGFAWGGDWGYTDPMHFEMARLVRPGR
jgi:hypothetical protein